MRKMMMALGLLAGSTMVQAESGFTIEGLVGIADQKSTINSESGDDKDTSLGVRAGFQFNDFFAVELGYRDFGEVADRSVNRFGNHLKDTVEADAFELGVKGMLPLSKRFSLLGRAGVARWDYDIREIHSAFPGQVFKDDDSGADFYYGVGAQFNATKNLFFTAEYTYLEMDLDLTNNSGEHEVKNLSVSIGYKF